MNIAIREKDRQVIHLAIFIVIVLIDLVLILGWQFRSLLKYFKTAGEKKQAIITLENDARNLDRYKQEIAALDEKIKNPKILIPDEEDISVLIQNISNLADSSGVKIIQIKPIIDTKNQEIIKAKDGSFSKIGIQIVANSDFHRLGNFLSKVESEKNFLKISSLQIETDNKNYFIQNVSLSLISFVHTKE